MKQLSKFLKEVRISFLLCLVLALRWRVCILYLRMLKRSQKKMTKTKNVKVTSTFVQFKHYNSNLYVCVYCLCIGPEVASAVLDASVLDPFPDTIYSVTFFLLTYIIFEFWTFAMIFILVVGECRHCH